MFLEAEAGGEVRPSAILGSKDLEGAAFEREDEFRPTVPIQITADSPADHPDLGQNLASIGVYLPLTCFPPENHRSSWLRIAPRDGPAADKQVEFTIAI